MRARRPRGGGTARCRVHAASACSRRLPATRPRPASGARSSIDVDGQTDAQGLRGERPWREFAVARRLPVLPRGIREPSLAGTMSSSGGRGKPHGEKPVAPRLRRRDIGLRSQLSELATHRSIARGYVQFRMSPSGFDARVGPAKHRRQIVMGAVRRTCLTHGFSVALALALLAAAGWWPQPVSAEDAPPPPLAPYLERLFPQLSEERKALTPFLRDADLTLHLRTYYFNRTNPNDTVNEALAFGGWIGLKSGWLLDTFAMGATLYGSAPLYAPDDRDGTLLLKPGQEGYYVPGEAWGALRYKEYALLTGYRQLVDQTYINPQDNRMTPNTFQGVTLGGKVDWVKYLVGYLWEIKPRNSDEFISMSQQAGAGTGSNDGVGLAGVTLTPLKGLKFNVSNQY